MLPLEFDKSSSILSWRREMNALKKSVRYRRYTRSLRNNILYKCILYIIYTYTLPKVCRVVASCIWMEGHVHFLMPKWYPLPDMPFFRPKPSAVQSYDRKRWFQEMRASLFHRNPRRMAQSSISFNWALLWALSMIKFCLFFSTSGSSSAEKCQIINYEQLKHMSHVFRSWLLGKMFPSLNWNV